MSLYTESVLRAKGSSYVQKSRPYSNSRSILMEAKSIELEKDFDIFLSHCYMDADLVLGLKVDIEELGYAVYVDWIEDCQLDRSSVNKQTANLLRARMRHCKCLFFATSPNSTRSIWMPWECGYFDGFKGKVAVCPILKESVVGNSFSGQEYLGLYPYISRTLAGVPGRYRLLVHEASGTYVDLDSWLKGHAPYKHTTP